MSKFELIIKNIFFFEVGSAISTDRSQNQWIDLGIQTEACMALPDTCGAAGGAISMWLKVDPHPANYRTGILTSVQTFDFNTDSTGFVMLCNNVQCR